MTKTIPASVERQLERGAKHRLAVIRHVEEVSGNVAATCRYYGISRQAYYGWLKRYETEGKEQVGSCTLALTTPSPGSAA